MPKISFLGKKQVMTCGNSTKSTNNYTLQEPHSLFITAKRAEGLRDRILLFTVIQQLN